MVNYTTVQRLNIHQMGITTPSNAKHVGTATAQGVNSMLCVHANYASKTLICNLCAYIHVV